MSIKRGRSYKDMFLLGRFDDTRHDVTKTDAGFSIVRVTNYIASYKTKLVVNDNGTAISLTKVDTNYHATYQYTTYFNVEGMEIIGKSLHAERKHYNELQ